MSDVQKPADSHERAEKSNVKSKEAADQSVIGDQKNQQSHQEAMESNPNNSRGSMNLLAEKDGIKKPADDASFQILEALGTDKERVIAERPKPNQSRVSEQAQPVKTFDRQPDTVEQARDSSPSQQPAEKIAMAFVAHTKVETILPEPAPRPDLHGSVTQDAPNSTQQKERDFRTNDHAGNHQAFSQDCITAGDTWSTIARRALGPNAPDKIVMMYGKQIEKDNPRAADLTAGAVVTLRPFQAKEEKANDAEIYTVQTGDTLYKICIFRLKSATHSDFARPPGPIAIGRLSRDLEWSVFRCCA